MDSPITVVTGLGRCGSSLVMQMLDAAGHPIYGPEESRHPAYEHPNAAGLPDYSATWNRDDPRRAWLAEACGKAVKILDPYRCILPDRYAYRIIFCTRAVEHQARSQMKFLGLLAGVTDDRKARRAMTVALRRDTNKALAQLRTLSHARIGIVSFEALIDDPEGTAGVIARFLGLPPRSVDAMAKCVIPRSSDCYDGMLELGMLRGVAA